MRHYIPRNLVTLYHALIAPYLNYGICAWCSCPCRPISIRYLSVPKRALRLIYFSTNPETMQSLFLLNQTAFLCSLCSFNS